MQFTTGWSQEIGSNQWAKADITIDQSDLDRILGPAKDSITAFDMFTLASNEADVLLLAYLMKKYPAFYTIDKFGAELTGYKVVRRELLAKYGR